MKATSAAVSKLLRAKYPRSRSTRTGGSANFSWTEGFCLVEAPEYVSVTHLWATGAPSDDAGSAGVLEGYAEVLRGRFDVEVLGGDYPRLLVRTKEATGA